MAKTIKQKLKKNLLVLVLLLTTLTKLLEWTAQYIVNSEFVLGLKDFWYIQIGFILAVSIILFVGFNYMKVKKKNYLLIPVLAYFIKEVYNFIFVYGRVLNQVTLIALVLEPLLLYGLVLTLNKYWLKIK